jgi:hypothetical protein
MEVYISTNKAQPANCFATDDDTTKVKILVADLNRTEPKKISEGVFLIHQDLESITVDKTKACLLRHTTIKDEVVKAFDGKLIKTGQHVQGQSSLYEPVFKILLDDSIKDKLSEILKKLGFTEKDVQEKQDIETKKYFLSYIYDGNLPVDYQIPQSIMDVEGINELIQYFKLNPYQKNDKGSDLCSESNIKYVQLMTLLGFKR